MTEERVPIPPAEPPSEAADTSVEAPVEGAEGLPEDVRDGDVGEEGGA